jgi:heme/copper-type cytochrome/quinol oxidase subunit 2
MFTVSKFSILMIVLVIIFVSVGFFIKLRAERNRNKRQAKKGSDLIFFGLCVLFISTVFVIIKLITQ